MTRHHPACPARHGHPECVCPANDPSTPGWVVALVWAAIALALIGIWGSVGVVIYRGWTG